MLCIGVLIAGYKAGKYNELRRIRCIFKTVEKNLFEYFKSERETASHDGVTFGELPKETVAGAGFAVQKMLAALDEEEKNINHEFIDSIKNVIRRLWK